MKVTATLVSYPPERLLGGELMTSLLLERLAAEGHEVTVLTGAKHDGYTRGGVSVLHRAAVGRRHLLEADVVVSHPEIAQYVQPALHGLSAWYVGIVHNLGEETMLGLRKARPDVVVANARATAEAICDYDPIVIHPPVVPERLRSPGMERRFVTLVNLSKSKGADVFWRMAEAMPDTQFLGVVGGHGPQDLQVADNVWIVGQTIDMGLVYGMTKVLIFPSRTETYGMVAAEALASGIPVVANLLPGIVEAVGDGVAAWVGFNDYDRWVDVVGTLMRDDDEYDIAATAARKRGDEILAESTVDLDVWVELVEGLGCRGHRPR